MAARRSFGFSIAAVILLVASCSSGGGKQSAATTTTQLTTPTTVATATGSPSHVFANRSKCPSIAPSISLSALNARVSGLGTKLVPFTALSVRICGYAAAGQLGGSVLVKPITAAKFERETNLLRPPPRLFNGNCGGDGTPFLVIFASNTEQVDVADVACGSLDATNGVFSALPTAKWLNELQRFTTPVDVAAPNVVGDTGAEAVSVLSSLGFVIAPTGAVCCLGVLVVGQHPKAGVLVPRRTTVTMDLAINAGPQCCSTTGPGVLPAKPTG